MKQLFLFFSLMLSFAMQAQELTYEEWNTQAKSDLRLLPKYGGIPKNEKQKIADQKLIDDYTASEGSREKGSEKLVLLGFNYLYKGDIKTAMYRFNQGWLLNPENENVFWGFGSVYFTYGDFTKALEQYDEGLTIKPESSDILTDKATIYMVMAQQQEDNTHLDKATELFLKAYSFNKKNQNTLFKLSVCYFYKDDCKNAKRYLAECDKLGGKPVTAEYRTDLKEKCK